MNRIAAVIVGLSLAFVGTSASFAATINVPGDYPTIQGAINASSNGDVIQIAPGTYYESNINPGGKAITIQGIRNSDGALETIIDGQLGGGVFKFVTEEGQGTILTDLMITGGLANYGGGIYCYENSSPTISGCTISGNTAYSTGGGIYCYKFSNPTIRGCTISGNTGYSYGGGIYCGYDSTPTISNCTIEGNQSYNNGGGIYCWDSFPTISDCEFIDNSADNGGGLYCRISNPTITGCTISGHTVYNGGGIYCDDSSPTITDCTISGNAAEDNGGGIYCIDSNYGSSPTITNCTISGNAVGEGGVGGIYCHPAIGEFNNPYISDSEICGNEYIQINGPYTDNGGNTVADECPEQSCADLNSSGVIDIEDLLLLIGYWGTSGGDCDADDDTDIEDLLYLIGSWGDSC